MIEHFFFFLVQKHEKKEVRKVAALGHIFKFESSLFPETPLLPWSFDNMWSCEESCALDVREASLGTCWLCFPVLTANVLGG